MGGCGQSPPFSRRDGLGDEAVTGRAGKGAGSWAWACAGCSPRNAGGDKTRLVTGRVCHGWINVEGFAGEEGCVPTVGWRVSPFLAGRGSLGERRGDGVWKKLRPLRGEVRSPVPQRAGKAPVMGKTFQNPASFRDTPKSGAPLCSAFARRANSVERAHLQRTLPHRGKAASQESAAFFPLRQDGSWR